MSLYHDYRQIWAPSYHLGMSRGRGLQETQFSMVVPCKIYNMLQFKNQDLTPHNFERAIAISDGKNLMAKVMYAQQYARLMYDRDLHDRVLKEVLSAGADVPGYVLINTLAKQQAQSLFESAEEYF